MAPAAQSAPLTSTSGCSAVDDLVRRVFVEDHDGVDARERREHFGALGLAIDRPIRALLERARRSIGVDGDDQRIAQAPRLAQIAHVAGMQEIEHAVGEDDLLAAGPAAGRPRRPLRRATGPLHAP